MLWQFSQMPPLKDRFDRQVEKARSMDLDDSRLRDFLIGILFGCLELHFLNAGDKDSPRPRFVELDGEVFLLTFSDPSKADDFTVMREERDEHDPLGLISMPPYDAATFAEQFIDWGCQYLLVNPGPFSFAVDIPAYCEFHKEWEASGGREQSGFFIPNLTTEEQDLWEADEAELKAEREAELRAEKESQDRPLNGH